GPRTRAMWVMTFHSACARILRADADKLGYTRNFTIYDESDSLRLVKRCAEELEIDTKRYAPRGLRRQISDAKNQLLDAAGYREKVSSFFEQTAADVYDLYERRSHAMNAMDFDDLLLRSVNLFELYPESLARSYRTITSVSARRSGPTSPTATCPSSASSRTSTARRAMWPARSSGSSSRGCRATRSRSSTGPTRSRASSRTRWCATASPT